MHHRAQPINESPADLPAGARLHGNARLKYFKAGIWEETRSLQGLARKYALEVLAVDPPILQEHELVESLEPGSTGVSELSLA